MKKHIFLSLILLVGVTFTQHLAQAAISDADCKASGQGASCNYATVGNGCEDEAWTSDTNFEKNLGACTAISKNEAPKNCCVPYVSLCQKMGARVTTGQCNPGDKVPYQWGSSRCCIGTTKSSTPSGSITMAQCQAAKGTCAKAGTSCPSNTNPNGNCALSGPCCVPAPTNTLTMVQCQAASGTCAKFGENCPSGKVQKGVCALSGPCCVAGTGNPTTNPGTGNPGTDPGTGNPTTAPGAATPTLENNVTISFESPTKYTTVESFLDSVLSFARNIVVILALIFLVIGGLLYITSAGNDKRINAAKAAITAALIGLAIVMVAPSFLKELAGVLGWGDQLSGEAANALSLTQIATNVLNFLLSIIGILAIIMFLIGGIMYLTSAGDEKRADTGKKIVTSSIIGIIVAFSALVIVRQIADFFVK